MEVTTPRVTMSFRVPRGAADAFHAAHPSVEQVEEWLEQAGLRVVESQEPLPHHRFLRALVP
jgi:signal recognition particle GTPase